MNARRSRPSSDRSTRSPTARPREALGRRLSRTQRRVNNACNRLRSAGRLGHRPRGRVAELGRGIDRTREVTEAEFASAAHLAYSAELESLKQANFFIVTVPKFAAQAIRKAYDIGWHPQEIVVSVGSSIAGAIRPAGFEAAKGIISAAYQKDPADPQWRDDPGQVGEEMRRAGAAGLDMRGQLLPDAGQHRPAGPGQAASIVTPRDRAPATDHTDRPGDLLGNRGHPVADDSLYRNRRRAKASDHRAGRVARQHHLGGPHLGERRDDSCKNHMSFRSTTGARLTAGSTSTCG